MNTLSATTYQKLGEKRTTFTEIQSNLHKFDDVIERKLVILSSDAIMITS